MAKQRIEYLAVDRLDIERTLVSGGSEVNLTGISDEKAKVSSNDTTPGFLNGKLVAGANVTLTENNNGGNETLTIAANFTDADDKVKVSAGDTTPAFLDTKILAGTNITLTKGNAGGNETLTVSAAGGGVTSVNTLTGAVTLTAASVGAAPTSHTHAASDVTSGVFNTSRLASSGTANSTTFLRGDQTWATVAGGVTGFTPSQNTSAPNATINASRLLVDATTTNADIVLQPKGTGSLLAQLPDNTLAGGMKRGIKSVDLQMHRFNSKEVAEGSYSAILGGAGNFVDNRILDPEYSGICYGNSNTIDSAAYGSIVGGYNNKLTESGSHCFVGSGEGNEIIYTSTASLITGGFYNYLSNSTYATISGGSENNINGSAHYSTIGGGKSNTTTGTRAFIGGGETNTASGSHSSVLGGVSNVATGTHSAVLGGNLNSAQSNYSVVSGNGAVSYGLGCSMFASGSFAAPGDCQTGEWVQRTFTSDAANQTAYLTNTGAQGVGGTGANLNYVWVRTGATMAYQWIVVGKRTDVVGANAAWTVNAAATNNSGLIDFLGTPIITLIGDNTGGAVSISVEKHSQSRSLNIRVNGVAGQTWRWAGFLRTIELSS